MRKLVGILVLAVLTLVASAQAYMPKDTKKTYKKAEKLKKSGEYNRAIELYKEVLRSVEHIPSIVSCGEIELELRKKPNYIQAYDFYTRAIAEIDKQLNAQSGKTAKLAKLKQEILPKQKKSKSYVDQFNNAKERKKHGNRLLDVED